MNSSQFTDTRLIDFPQANPLLTKILTRYGLEPNGSPSPAALVELRIALPQGSSLLWDRATSLPRGPRRRQLLRSVSVTLQDALRCWIPYLWLSFPEHWEERYLLWPMLIYGASRTFKPVSRQTYTFDLLSETTVPALLRSCLPALRDWMPHLQAINRQWPHPLREFNMPRLLDVVERSDFDPHPLKRLLAHEHRLIAAFTDLADSHAEQRRGFDHFGVELHRHLNRMYTNVDFSFLAPLLHIEAENTLAIHLLGRPILETHLSVLTPPAGTKPYRLPRPRFTDHRMRASTIRQPNDGPSVQVI